MGKGSTLSDPTGGAHQAADAAQRAAEAQQAQSQANYDRTNNLGRAATTISDRSSVQALRAQGQALAQQSQNLSRQEQLISQIDPTIIEASQQALKLLRGEQSSTLAPLQAQRNTQREKLLNSLREQLGPGAETSTAGIQALNRFDAETANVLGAGQQNALQQLGQTAGQFNSVRPDMLREISGFGALNQQRYQIGQNSADARFKWAQALQPGMQGLANSAGAQYVGQPMIGQGNQAFGNQLIGAGAQIGAAYATGGTSLMAQGASQQAARTQSNANSAQIDQASSGFTMPTVGGR